jgi:hypothetical protein
MNASFRFRASVRAVFFVLFSLWFAQNATAVELRTAPQAVVELFTSQGCASCPPADLLLNRLGHQGNVVALAYHVDYWDYAGWEDTFASPAHGELQKAYAQSWGKSRIYTPQAVINGSHGVVGSHARDVHEAIAAGRLPLTLGLRLVEDEVVHVTAPPQSGMGEAVVWLVTFRASAEIDIERGENTGQHLVYSHIVTGRQPVGMWSPSEGTDIRIPLSEALGGQSDGAAILVQERRQDLPGPIIGAASVLR